MRSSTHLLDFIQHGSTDNATLHDSFVTYYDVRKKVLCVFETMPETVFGFPIVHVSIFILQRQFGVQQLITSALGGRERFGCHRDSRKNWAGKETWGTPENSIQRR
jgi:hypothetical protein